MTAPIRPPRVHGRYEDEFWEFVGSDDLRLQSAPDGSLRYPPGPVAPGSLAPEYTWTPIAGTGRLIAWTVFRRAYFPDIPVPYTVVVVRTAEGPLMVGHLAGDRAASLRHGMPMAIAYEDVSLGGEPARIFTWKPRESPTEQEPS